MPTPLRVLCRYVYLAGRVLPAGLTVGEESQNPYRRDFGAFGRAVSCVLYRQDNRALHSSRLVCGRPDLFFDPFDRDWHSVERRRWLITIWTDEYESCFSESGASHPGVSELLQVFGRKQIANSWQGAYGQGQRWDRFLSRFVRVRRAQSSNAAPHCLESAPKCIVLLFHKLVNPLQILV